MHGLEEAGQDGSGVHGLEDARTAQVCMPWRRPGRLKCAWPGGDQDDSSVHEARIALVCMAWRESIGNVLEILFAKEDYRKFCPRYYRCTFPGKGNSSVKTRVFHLYLRFQSFYTLDLMQEIYYSVRCIHSPYLPAGWHPLPAWRGARA